MIKYICKQKRKEDIKMDYTKNYILSKCLDLDHTERLLMAYYGELSFDNPYYLLHLQRKKLMADYESLNHELSKYESAKINDEITKEAIKAVKEQTPKLLEKEFEKALKK